MGNVMSRLAIILRRKKVTPEQIRVPRRNLIYERCDETEGLMEQNEPERCDEVSSVVDPPESRSSYHTIMAESPDHETTESGCLKLSSTSEQNSEMIYSTNYSKSAQTGKIILLDAETGAKEATSPANYLIQNSNNEMTSSDISSEKILTMENTKDSAYYESHISSNNRSSQDADGHERNCDSFSWISTDSYSREGTVGSGSFGDRDDDIIDRLLVDNVDDMGINYGRLNEVPNVKRSSLTPVNLEILNSIGELDKRECVRSYIQAWSPLNLPTAATCSNSLPGACADLTPEDEPQTSPEDYDRLSSEHEFVRSPPNEPRDLDEMNSKEFCLFYEREIEPVSRSLSGSWDLLRNDRAPWINIESEGYDKVVGEREGSIGDDQDSDWPRGKADSWQDSNKGLIICSLSTINEESDNADKTDH